MKNKLVILIVVLLGCIAGVKAQNIEYIAELDTNYIMIGDQIHLKMKVKADPGVRVVCTGFDQGERRSYVDTGGLPDHFLRFRGLQDTTLAYPSGKREL